MNITERSRWPRVIGLARSPTAWFRVTVVALLLWNVIETRAAREEAENAAWSASDADTAAQSASQHAEQAADSAEEAQSACLSR